ncbi:putative nuclease with TOPRIM domain [Elusimicrobium posterum]|uniref:hypothetical protein n=1 Tax=Elusimicrobium posterum TaxID=3116653 RepID=UPI003C748D6D
MTMTINPAFIALCGFCFTLLSALVAIGVFWGTIKTQIIALKEAIQSLKTEIKEDIGELKCKQDKYNNLQERMAKVEARTASNTHRINKLEC